MKKLFSWLLLIFVISSASAVTLMQGVTKFEDQTYWCGKAKVVTENGKKVLELVSTIKNSSHYGRAYAAFGTSQKYLAKDKLAATAKVRGKGKFFIGILKYRPKIGMPVIVFAETIELTEKAKDVKFVFELEKDYEKVFPFMQIQGEGKVYVESFKLEKSNDKDLKISKVVPSVNATVKDSKAQTAQSQQKPLYSGVKAFEDQPYWGGKAKVITENGKKVLELVSTIKNSSHYGRAYAAFWTSQKYLAKDKIVATAVVRGKGDFFIGILKYRPKIGMPVTVFAETIPLTEKAKEVKFVFELDNAYEKIYPFVQVQGDGKVYVESFKLEKSNDKNLKISKVVPAVNSPIKSSKTKAVKAPEKPLYSGVTGFKDQPYWGGKAKVITENGKKVLELTSTVKGNRHFGRAYAGFWVREIYMPGTKIEATIKVRGKGKFAVGILKYRPKQGAPTSDLGKNIELTDAAKEFKFDFEIENFYDRVYPYINIDGAGTAYIESFRLERSADNTVKITAKTPLQILTATQKAAPVEFATSLKNQEIYIGRISKKNLTEKIKSDKDGKVVVPAFSYPVGTSHIYAAAKGVGVQSFISVVTPEEYAETDAIARKIKIKKPIKMLMLGDSLSDFYRGYNYIDRISFWLNKYNPGKFTFHNAGVGGDFLERASNRMEVELKYLKKYVWRQNMYDGIFKNVYDYVFIFMGQNDTRCMPKDNYSTPETTVEEQQKYLSLMQKRLKQYCPKAKIVIIAPSPSDKSVFEGYLAKGRKYAFYGKTKFVDDYDAYNRKFCKENNIDYIDILSKMRNYKPLKDLYVVDGVHLSDKGGILIADEILKYFEKEFK